MKKGAIFVVLFIVLITATLHLYGKSVSTTSDSVVPFTREEKDVTLNDFLSGYRAWIFSKVEVIDDTKIVWYQLLGTKKTSTLIGWPMTQEEYRVYNTDKLQAMDLHDLGMSLTWATNIIVSFTEQSVWSNIIEQVVPFMLFLIFLFIMAKFMLPKWGGLPFSMKIGKVSVKKDAKTKFADVAGMEEVKAELEEIVDYLKNPAKYHKVWARHPKGVLLYGQPGSGKTLLARAVAWESDVPFFSASGSEFMEMLVGMGAAKVRELFWKAKAAGKAIIFIDEIDAIGKRRGVGHTGGHQEQEQTLNQILTEMDGFDNQTNIVVIAATNRPDTLDPALLRAGRFDRKIMVSRPTYEERIAIFNYYLQKKKVAKDVRIESLAKRTTGLVGADIENIVNEASLKIARDGRSSLEVNDFEYALEKVLMWPEKKIKSITEKERNIIAYHELGHAVTAHVLPDADDVEKISIVSRGQALWVTWMMPDEDKYLYSKNKFLEEVISLLGWRAAEEIFFGKEHITTWASNDFERATKIINDLVVKYGMDDDIWPVMLYDKDKDDYGFSKPYSEKTAQIVDEKIKSYLVSAYDKAKKILTDNKEKIEKIAQVLLAKEYVTKDEFSQMMDDISYADTLYNEEVSSKPKTKSKK